MPRLDLLPEDSYDAIAVSVKESLAELCGVDGLELRRWCSKSAYVSRAFRTVNTHHLLAEGADIVKI
jgi:hypothetical protein